MVWSLVQTGLLLHSFKLNKLIFNKIDQLNSKLKANLQKKISFVEW